MRIEQEIHQIFKRHDYRWKIDGRLIVPSESDILETIESAKTYLDEGGSVEVGRLIIRKYLPELEKYDVYVLIGEIDDEKD